MKTADTETFVVLRKRLLSRFTSMRGRPAPTLPIAQVACGLALAGILLAAMGAHAQGRSLRLEGVGTRSMSTASDVGEPGETVTISVDLHSEDFDYVPVANFAVHAFEPNTTVPVSVVGEVTGPYPSVAPISRFAALEQTESEDRIALDVGVGETDLRLFTSLCNLASCFDGNITPFTSDELFDLFEQSVSDPVGWRLSVAPAAVWAGPENDHVSLGVVDWTLTDLDALTGVSVTPTVDVQLTPGSTFTIEEGADSLAIDSGFGQTFPRIDALMEFSLEDVPEGATIAGATLTLDGVSSSASVSIGVEGYAGDGLASTADASATTTEIAESDPLDAFEDIVLQLDAAYVQSLLGASSHLGLRLSSLMPNQNLAVRSSESVLGEPPTLTLEFEGGPGGLAGDFNGDGVVDALDYATWRDGLGTT